MNKIIDAKEMSFLRIGEYYPNNYILIQIIEINHDIGKEVGIPLFTSNDSNELLEMSKLLKNTTILPGDNLLPVLGGLL
jgi:hypothetical protein